MDLLAIVLMFVVSPISLVTFIVLSIIGEKMLSLPFLFPAILSLLVGYLLLYKVNSHVLKRFDARHFKLSKKLSGSVANREIEITFVKNVEWEYYSENNTVPFNLKGIVFKRSFLVSFLARAFRYNIISNRLRAKTLSKIVLNGFSKSITIHAIFLRNGRRKKVAIIKNGKSKLNLMPWLFIAVNVPATRSYRLSPSTEAGKRIMQLDEEVFCSFDSF